jgi:hypothetical protein
MYLILQAIEYQLHRHLKYFYLLRHLLLMRHRHRRRQNYYLNLSHRQQRHQYRLQNLGRLRRYHLN